MAVSSRGEPPFFTTWALRLHKHPSRDTVPLPRFENIGEKNEDRGRETCSRHITTSSCTSRPLDSHTWESGKGKAIEDTGWTHPSSRNKPRNRDNFSFSYHAPPRLPAACSSCTTFPARRIYVCVPARRDRPSGVVHGFRAYHNLSAYALQQQQQQHDGGLYCGCFASSSRREHPSSRGATDMLALNVKVGDIYMCIYI